MASTYSALKLELMATGEDDGTWGDKTNANLLAIQQTLSETGQISLASADFTVPYVDSSAPQSFRGMRFAVIGTSGGAVRTVTMPATPKFTAFHNGVADPVLFKNPGVGGSTITVPPGRVTLVYSDGVNMIPAMTYSPSLLVDSFAVTGSASFAGAVSFTGTPTLSNGLNITAGGINVVGNSNFNGFVGVTGTLSVNGTLRTSYVGVLKGTSGTGDIVAATPGTDYARPDTASTWTAQQYFAGTANNTGFRIVSGSEFDIADPVILAGLYTWNLTNGHIIWIFNGISADFQLSIQGSSGVPLSSFVPVGDFITLTFIVNQGLSTNILTALTFSGTAPAFIYWAGGSQPTPQVHTNSVYTFAIRNVGAGNNHQVFASMTSFGPS